MPQQLDIFELACIFAFGVFVGMAVMYAFRSYEVRQVLRLKDELAAEHRLLWNQLNRRD